LVRTLEEEHQLALVAADHVEVRHPLLHHQASLEAALPGDSPTGGGSENLLELALGQWLADGRGLGRPRARLVRSPGRRRRGGLAVVADRLGRGLVSPGRTGVLRGRFHQSGRGLGHLCRGLLEEAETGLVLLGTRLFGAGSGSGLRLGLPHVRAAHNSHTAHCQSKPLKKLRNHSTGRRAALPSPPMAAPQNPTPPPHEPPARIVGDLPVLPEEWVPLEDAAGRGLVTEVVARRTQPPWDNSAMDGYAVRTADLGTLPAALTVVDVVHAGAMPGRAVGRGEAIRIMTGAPVPPGADAVVMQERTRALGGAGLGRVEVLEAPAPRANIRDAGEDAREGEVLLAGGTALGIPELALLSAQGLTAVR